MKKVDKSVVLIVLAMTVLLSHSVFAVNSNITGKIISANTGKPVEYVNIFTETGEGVYSDKFGDFVLKNVKIPCKITISHIAFEDTILFITNEKLGVVRLVPTVIHGKDVFVTATRAIEGVTPVAFSNVTIEEIETRYTVEDVPMILAMEPGVYSYSESGNGTGYSYVQIRGFDQSRIAVLLDNVPLNDNESYQVYWVDHADILADVEVVQIQRGVGNSLYGSSAFGGSVNVQTSIASDVPEASFTVGVGSYHTDKIVMKLNSGQLFGDRLSTQIRYSQIKSKGYRGYHDSYQGAGALGIEYRGKNVVNQFRALIGYEKSYLAWDGISSDYISDRTLRRQGNKQYIDNFLQQIYSLNSYWKISEKLRLTNTAYYVHGSGYYESYKLVNYNLDDESWRQDRVDFYQYLMTYNLDKYYPGFPWLDKTFLGIYFTRRKWIVNDYFGTIPTITWEWEKGRLDIGGEVRYYQGDHFGEISKFDNIELLNILGDGWFRYYQYTGKKYLVTEFAHLMLEPLKRIKLTVDFQQQNVFWSLDQDTIGYAQGYQLDALWIFLNPRFGMICNLTDYWSVFVNYSVAQREPADNQIIEADDVWNEPKKASAEIVNDFEIGANLNFNNWFAVVNLYHMWYFNEQLKNIDIEQEGEYDYYQVGKTLHQGIECELGVNLSQFWTLNLNTSFSRHIYNTGDQKGKTLPNVPCVLFNGGLTLRPFKGLTLSLISRYVGRQFIDEVNKWTISDYWIFDGNVRINYQNMELSAKVNNIFDILYTTYGYVWDGDWAYYWPGATRNAFVTFSINL